MRKAIALMLCVMIMLTGCSAYLPKEGREDYYTYINKNGVLKAEIPSYRPVVNPLYEVNDSVNNMLKGYLDGLEGEYEVGSDEQKLRDFYALANDFEKRNKEGVSEIAPYIDILENVESVEEYIDAMLILHEDLGSQSVINFEYAFDFDGSGRYALYLAQSPLISPYVQWSSSQRLNDVYIKYLARLFELGGYSDSEDIAEAVYRFENTLRQHMSNSDVLPYREDYCNRYSLEEACEIFNHCDFEKVLKTVGSEDCSSVVINDVVEARYINSILNEENLPMLKKYAIAVLYNDYVYNLDWEHIVAGTDFEKDRMIVEAEPYEQWRYALKNTKDVLGMQLGCVYEKSMYDKAMESDVEQITKDIIEGYKAMLEGVDWLEDESREMLLKKLDDIEIRVAFGTVYEPWYSQFDITSGEDGGTMVGNIIEAKRAKFKYDVDMVGETPTENVWRIMPYTANAYYYRDDNSINVPVDILTEPFYYKKGDYEKNMGGIGVIIAHEISHAFDRNGAQYGLRGKVENWWSEKAFARFDRLADRVDYQYSKLEVFEKTFVNGTMTASENIADLAAINVIASVVESKGGSLDKMFRNFALAFGENASEKYTRYLIKGDSHTPAKQRVNQMLSNCDRFYETYDIDENDGMYIAPEDRVGIWK